MEERTIKLSIDVARDWYYKGSKDLRTLALQAYTEDELKLFIPTSWEQLRAYKMKNKKMVYKVNSFDEVYISGADGYFNELNTEEEEKAFVALGKLIQLRDAWWKAYDNGKGWSIQTAEQYADKISIVWNGHEFCFPTIRGGYVCNRIFVFPSYDIAKEFYTTFSDLFDKAKMFI